MRSVVRVGLVATLALSTLVGCEDEEALMLDADMPDMPGEDPRPVTRDRDAAVEDGGNAGRDAGGQLGGDAGVVIDGGMARPDAAPANPAPEPQPIGTPRTQVPDELVGAWDDGALDFTTWENYREGYWAGRNAAPTREAMVFSKNGDAKFYRYEFALNVYEELIDCEGTVAFHGDGTFTFYPVSGRKRFHDFSYSPQSVDRALTADELVSPDLAGTRAYAYIAGSAPASVQITVPSSAPYRWYKKE